ncbi:hypothetical protein ACFP1I_14030 [Dyadobacter subterraneus]|uniref:Lipoprotein n=1 Tax=Dyadobacter subterraneus TaxID=2773304 RepID=A0ABR9WJK7_9BACT|nr:hypothetical protein [Dyadobacter subterraneus]MBE9465309.1 hypothetical protein [Dyadobacter subterraneus]
MKKLFLIITAVFGIAIISCKNDDNNSDPKTSVISITESVYLPYDSVTTQYQLDRNGMIILEKSSKYGTKKGYRDNEALNSMESSLKYCKIFTYGSSDQLLKITDIDDGGRKLPSSTDSLIYQNNRVVRREQKNYLISASLGTFIFPYPLWVSKLYFDYDASGKIQTETDSVFISHDIAKNSSVLEKTGLKFAYKVLIKNEYNERGELMKKTTESFKTTNLLYSNGSTANDMTLVGKLISGSTIYNYQYNAKSQLVTQLLKFTDSSTNKVYNSIFSYAYGYI